MNAHNFMRESRPVDANGTPTLRSILAADWKLIFIGALASFFLASILMSGMREGLIPDLSTPYGYAGDGLFHAWMAQRVAEGWVFDNTRSGYPFGSNFLDFPGSDAGAHLVIKLSAMLGGGWVAGVNLFFLLGFAVCFIATYVTARAFGLNRSFAMTASALYTFVPFHFLRLHHLFYTWYFVAPLFFYLALDVYRTREPAKAGSIKSKLGGLFAMAVGMLVLSSFGVYYALFGAIIITLAGIFSAIRAGNLHGIKKAALLSAAIVAGVLINITPNLVGNFSDGRNVDVAQRSPFESEIYGLKMMQLIMPRPEHRVSYLAELTRQYNRYTPVINENATSSIGVIGAAGFMLILVLVALAPARSEGDDRLRLLAATTFVLFLFATIGGLGSLFAMLVSPSIRGWNRASIFIACGSILFFFISLQILLQRKAPRLANYPIAISAMLLLVGLYDQTAPACQACNSSQKVAFENDKDFIHAVEKALPAGAAIYQLPYMGFPEVPPLHTLANYQMTAGVLHSSSLHWSFGGMKGRPGDLFYRSLAQEPMVRQLEVVRKLGFEGIQIDRRGYADNADALITELSQLLQHPPLLQSDNKELVFFKLDGSAHPQLTNLSAKQIMDQAGYFADAWGPRIPGDLATGIDFTQSLLPDFISGAAGLYANEPWGRWSAGKKVDFDFADPLPQKFTLVLKAQAFASNANKPICVEVGSHEYSTQLTNGITEVRLDVDLKGTSAHRISFFPPNPVSPKRVAGSDDERILGIGFVSMRILQ
ncbi:sugar translocase [Pseudomonas sp. Irchel s3f7]|uniref:DUF7024 domain-containing protein n=1 Tax=Pseudomonas sp. Irchel s3f7 TaxID=2009153 RepID=UPI002114F498|nr:sugar translocase [Pseudomonas sp. Irchel s3f7]